MQGDRVLRAVANVLSDSVRQSNVVARYGGDEFAILMPEATTAQAEAFAERMRANIQNDPLLKQHGITASIGIATFPEHGPTKEEILRKADAGMYLAKYQSGNSRARRPVDRRRRVPASSREPLKPISERGPADVQHRLGSF